ncbi:viral A-type inclusion protein [Oceanivirga salmonicida]|uniref:viral A-type inclusion protein n=2 Tax=Oceanivirga salmonicida TaxID=1769291 RepID=UPI00352CFEB9
MRMTNPNSITDMEMFNIKNQAKLTQTLQKLGRGRRKLEIYLSKSSQKYIEQVMVELKKQMVEYEKQLPNIYDFFNYIIKQVHVEKKQRREKFKKIALSYEEQDFLVMQIKGTIKEIIKQRKNLKWYQFIKKLAFSSVRKQNELLLEEVLNKLKK